MLLEEVKTVLKEAGWYEGRRIDITEHIKFLEDMGYEVFDELKEFLQEYGDLKIILKDDTLDDDMIDEEDEAENMIEYSTYIIDIIKKYKRKVSQDRKAGEKTIPIAEIDNNEYLIYISESGKFYTYEGLWKSSSDKFWNCMFGSERERPLTWNELKKPKAL